jgi:hypothetical protein
MSNLTLVLACLRELDIDEAVVSLDGSGDSGDATLYHVVTRAGQTLYQLPGLHERGIDELYLHPTERVRGDPRHAA